MPQNPPHPGVEWIPVGHDLPKNEDPVLIIRPSGYLSSHYEVLTARYQPNFRPSAPWRDVAGDAITDSGLAPMAWQAKPEWLHPKKT